MARISVQKINSDSPGVTKRRVYATVAYYYPQYTMKQVSKMSVRDINTLISTVNKIEAQRMLQLTRIVAAPHTEKGKEVQKLISEYTEAMNGRS